MMEIETLPVWRQRLVAGAILLGGLLAAAVVLDAIVAHHAARARDIAEMHHLLDQYRAVAARRNGLERAIADFASVDEGGKRWYINGLNPALAAGKVQAMVKQMAGAAGATVHSAQTVDWPQEGAVRQVGVDVVLTVPMDGLVELVHGVETLEPLVFIERFVANPRQAGRGAPQRDIQVRLRVFALLDPGAEGSAS